MNIAKIKISIDIVIEIEYDPDIPIYTIKETRNAEMLLRCLERMWQELYPPQKIIYHRYIVFSEICN